MLGAIIGAGASLLGGIISNNSAKKAAEKQQEYQSPANVRKEFEQAGFNPLLGVSQMMAGSVQPASGQMGAAVSQAANMWLHTSQQEQQLEIQRTQLEQENVRLTRLAEAATLRPTVAGPMQRAAPVPRTNEPLPQGPTASSLPATGAGLTLPPQYRTAREDVLFEPATVQELHPDAPFVNKDGQGPGPTELIDNTLPQFTFGGKTYTGSGRYSSGAVFEDAVGETPLSWAIAPFVIGDAVRATREREGLLEERYTQRRDQRRAQQGGVKQDRRHESEVNLSPYSDGGTLHQGTNHQLYRHPWSTH